MPRASSKKTALLNSTAVNASGSHKGSSKESEKIDQLFYNYANKSSCMIDPEGIEALCSDMEMDHTDVKLLILAWKMQAEKQGYFTLARRTTNFMDFYQYAFRYCLTEEKQKSIDIESICQLLDLVLGSQFRAQVDYFIEYLNAQTDYKVMNMDQWVGFYRFCNEISFPDFSNYDADHAWPLILDNFVDWVKEKQT
ncbi:hypothetical protein KSS87_007613 [Heliosperma pusillum]|nr:hypothetical protein KSS87_007613 [Heliosperma pusillum]